MISHWIKPVILAEKMDFKHLIWEQTNEHRVALKKYITITFKHKYTKPDLNSVYSVSLAEVKPYHHPFYLCLTSSMGNPLPHIRWLFINTLLLLLQTLCSLLLNNLIFLSSWDLSLEVLVHRALELQKQTSLASAYAHNTIVWISFFLYLSGWKKMSIGC